MAISILAPHEIVGMRQAGAAAALTLKTVGERLKSGVSTAAIDAWVREHTRALGGSPSQLGYHGFPAAVCTSRNEVVCHGVPSATVVLRDGDIINIDITTNLSGFHGDCSETFIIGTASKEAAHVVDVARRARDLGVAMIRPNIRTGDIGAAIANFVRTQGCSSVREFGGHGIGHNMHEEPHVPCVGPAGVGVRLRPGMAITIEPMVNLGSAAIETLNDGWTVVTKDRRWSAQFEHTVLVTEDGYEIMTSL